MPPERPRRHPLLALTAYALVPGERRRRAFAHFRRAGVEAALGAWALAAPLASRPPGGERRGGRREHIEIE